MGASLDAENGLRLDLPDGRTVTGADDANAEMAAFGTRVWPIDLSAAPPAVRTLLRQPQLDETESSTVRDWFLLSRPRLLELIAAAGRQPSVPDGGALSTLDVVNDVTYPQLYVVAPGVDYRRFDRLHVNTADDGTELDEVMTILSGGGVRLVQRLDDGTETTLHLSCVGDHGGWCVSYGGHPHIGSFTGARPGTKVLVQAIGPARWQARYVDDDHCAPADLVSGT